MGEAEGEMREERKPIKIKRINNKRGKGERKGGKGEEQKRAERWEGI